MISAISSANQGIMSSMSRMERAADYIARQGLPDAPRGTQVPVPAAGPAGANAIDLPGATVDMMMAQRAFAAQIRVLRAAEETSREAVQLPRR